MYKILIVDDNEEFLKVQKLILEVFGYSCDTACDGAKALAMMRNDVYDMVISDYKMNGIKGIEILEYIKAHYPSMDFIMMTGNENDIDRERTLELGASGYILKGDDPQMLIDVVNKLSNKDNI